MPILTSILTLRLSQRAVRRVGEQFAWFVPLREPLLTFRDAGRNRTFKAGTVDSASAHGLRGAHLAEKGVLFVTTFGLPDWLNLSS